MTLPIHPVLATGRKSAGRTMRTLPWAIIPRQYEKCWLAGPLRSRNVMTQGEMS
jgi:phosphoribosylanthranilate isomerase